MVAIKACTKLMRARISISVAAAFILLRTSVYTSARLLYANFVAVLLLLPCRLLRWRRHAVRLMDGLTPIGIQFRLVCDRVYGCIE